MLFRSVRETDIDAIYHLTARAGTGLTNLPHDRHFIEKKVLRAQQSFIKSIETPKDEFYFFVLEDPKSGQIVGTSAIEACTGCSLPFYAFKRSLETQATAYPEIQLEHEILSLSYELEGYSEICSLFLSPYFRHSFHGLLLSRARFLFMATFPHRFKAKILAEIRGVTYEQKTPFWDEVMQFFFKMSFTEADRLTTLTDKKFIQDLMPCYPLYTQLLPKAAQAVIGKPHQESKGAISILLKEGFEHSAYVDIFDAGPALIAEINHIKTIKNHTAFHFEHTISEPQGPRYLIAHAGLEFRAAVGVAQVNAHHQTCQLSPETAHLLQLTPGDKILLSPLQYES